MMPFLWVLIPYLLPAAVIVVPLALICGIDIRVRRLRKSVQTCETSIQAEAAQLTNAVNELKRRFEEFENEGVTRRDPEPQDAGLSDMARGKVLKMHRVGRSTEQIAETLGLPKGEVDLLIKVHKVVMRPYEGVAPAGQMGA
ncbi:MAG: hypothetical protein LAP38_17580 [Acidobacteriia bacterium]|nr:hypothetical protein [Terriglobia bacterium]